MIDLTPSASVDEELARRAHLLAEADGNPALQYALMRTCEVDPLFWFDNFFWSYDPRTAPYHLPVVLWQAQRDYVLALIGEPGYTRGLPDDEADRELWPLIIEKSRDQGASVGLTGAAVYCWLFRPAFDWGLMTRIGGDLDDGTPNSLFGKIDYLLEYLPAWMTDGYNPLVHRRKAPQSSLEHPTNGNRIIGRTTTAGAYRGPRLRRIAIDEAAHIPKLNAIMPGVDGATNAPVLLSSVCGRGNTFARYAHGESVTCHQLGAEGSDGWRKITLHYRDDPRRDAKWAAQRRKGMTPEAWAQEYEIDYSASVPGRIWPEFDRKTHVYNPLEWAHVKRDLFKGGVLYEGWDFGSGPSLTAVVWALYLPAYDTLYLLDYRQWREARFDTVATGVAEAGWRTKENLQGMYPHVRVGDIAGTARDSGQRSWITNLATCGINIKGRTLRDADNLRALMRIKMAEDKILAAPACDEQHVDGLPTLVESILQYRRDITSGRPEEFVGDSPKARKDVYSHAADALQYIAAEVWQQAVATTVKQGPLHGAHS